MQHGPKCELYEVLLMLGLDVGIMEKRWERLYYIRLYRGHIKN